MDLLHMLEPVAASWSGPISLALYAADPDAVRFLQFYAASALLAARCNIGVHVVYAEGEYFPINFLRNVALRQAVFSLDFNSTILSPGSGCGYVFLCLLRSRLVFVTSELQTMSLF